MKFRIAVITVCLCGATITAQRGGPPQPQGSSGLPQFRSTVDLVHLDVSVLDKNRQPVRGLGPNDFTVLEDGQPQTITVFSAVDIPDDVAPPARWMRDVAPEVRTNDDLQQRRLFLIIIDDATIDANPRALQNVKTIVRSVIDRFGPSDLAAVVFTRDNRNSQDFTDDRARLLRAADKVTLGFRGMGPDDLWFNYSVSVVANAVKALSSLPDRRKAILYVGQGVPINLEDVVTGGRMSNLIRQMSETFRQAERANINVYTLDACGLRVDPAPPPPPPTCVPGLEVEYLQTVAGATHGRAVVNTNNFEPGLTAIFQENASYYLIGYQSTDSKTDGKFRRLDVRVNRPNVDVRTRSGYEADKPNAAKRRAELAASPLGAALSGIMPKGDLPLRLLAVPFAVPGKKEAAVAVVLGVRQPVRETGERTIENVDLQVRAFSVEGKPLGGTGLRADVTVRAGATGLAEYEVLSRLDLKPGRYQLRIAGSIGSLSTSGSLYYDIDVPDFASAPLSFSGLVLTASPGVPVAPRDTLTSVMPVVPTTRREFGAGDAVSAFMRVYQGGKAAPVPVAVRMELHNDKSELVGNRLLNLAAAEFTAVRSADVTLALPVSQWPAGSYLLTMEATLGKTTVRRDSRFTVR